MSQTRLSYQIANANGSRYANLETLSDIIVRYGNSGELTFHGHRLMLCVKSRWFTAALTGGFMVPKMCYSLLPCADIIRKVKQKKFDFMMTSHPQLLVC